MKTRLCFVRDRLILCDSGKTLNWLMHGFLFQVLVLGVALLFFNWTDDVQRLTLYRESEMFADGGTPLLGVVALATAVIHTAAFFIRGRVGVQMMRVAIFGGSYFWVYASLVYLQAGFVVQFLLLCIPNLFFWFWYALEWGKRKRGEEVAFV